MITKQITRKAYGDFTPRDFSSNESRPSLELLAGRKIFGWLIGFFGYLLVLSPSTWAATIKQVKNDRALIVLDGAPAQVGDQFFSLNPQNKKTAILEIMTVKGDRAIAKIVKGTAAVDYTVEARPRNGKESASARSAANPPAPNSKNPGRDTGVIRHDMKKFSISIKSTSDTISTKQKDNTQPTAREEQVDMTGTGLGLNFALDYPMKRWLYIHGFAGYEPTKLKGTAKYLSCDGTTSTDCNVEVTYLSFGALFRLNASFSKFELWAGAGAAFKQPLSKKSSALKEANIQLANSAIIALGVDYHLNNKMFIPLNFEYHKSFNESDTVPKIGQTALNLGFGFLF